MPRGRKPKPSHLRIVDGTHRDDRHGDATAVRDAANRARTAFGPLVKPPSLKGHGAKAWKRWIDPASWLDGSREAAAIAFCLLYQEFVMAPTVFPASKHGQMRAYMADLGLTNERNRAEKPAEDDDEFFD